MSEALRSLAPAEVDLAPREAAARLGLVRYVDGKPCVHGHSGERFTRNASCVECQRQRCRDDKARIRRLIGAAR